MKMLLSFAIIAGAFACKDNVIKQTKWGEVQGTCLTSRSGRHFQSFRGIPYAKPPIGNLRFKEPQPPDKWTGIYNAQTDPPPCLQKNYLIPKSRVEGSEDCLYINVHTPYVRDELLPVMVFIHWGGFFAGYSGSNYLGAEYFMDKDVVLVTFNYRLGVLGFLSTDDDSSPGNYGLKDQAAALRWVQDNIEYFGGNKQQVTLFGQSAGGASVHFHMLSPLSRGLFHSAISESGTALALWAKPLAAEQMQIARLQSTLVGCKDCDDSISLVDCLRRVNAEELVSSSDNFKYFDVDPFTVYLPSVEKQTKTNQQPFLTKQPVDYILAGEFVQVPWILGMVSDEGLVRAAALVSRNSTLNELNQHFNELMPQLMALVISTPKEKIQMVWEEIRQYYFQGESSVAVDRKKSIEGLVNLYTDRSFAYTLFQTALLHSKKGHSPLWLYNFRYQGQYSYRSLFALDSAQMDYDWGVSHCDELLYLFNSPAFFHETRHPNDLLVSEALITLWTNFATNSTPNSIDGAFNFMHHWSPVQEPSSNVSKALSYLDISGSYKSNDSIKFAMKDNFYGDRLKFWEKLPLVENIIQLDQQHIDL